MKKYCYHILLSVLAFAALASCSEDDGLSGSKNGGAPVVKYIRPCDAAASDSLLVRAYLGSRIAIIGENLGGVNKIYFNDQKAALNPNFVTDNAIIVDVPNAIPGKKEDLIRLYTQNDSCLYTFESVVPVPSVTSMTCEYVNTNDVAHLEGLYFVDDPNYPLTVTFTGDVEGEIVDFDVNNIYVTVPAGAQPGPISVTSAYGTGESSFHFRDNRNTILDFDTTFPDGGYHHGWHAGNGYGTENGLEGCGQYLIFTGRELADDVWDDTNFGYERWTYRETDPDFFDASNLADYVLKFEVNIPDPWSCCAFQIVFTGAEDVWMNWQETSNGGNPNNAYLSSSTYPRALWLPWTETGSYTTDGWITVTIPMSDFKYNGTGGSVAVNGPGHYSGITLFVGSSGGVMGTACTPTFHIDNVRVVEAN
ncbi:MAG TPA: hypothetical protein H9859_02895 [Candidatus Barnesiella excrementigallinarum]|nr:hypothetical protein [Candidatus Barnesiella excrementigallinarum]